MTLRDEDIAAIIDVEIGDVGFEVLLADAGIPSTGNPVEDLKTMATSMGIEDVEDLLYALFINEPLFDEDTWKNLTSDEQR